MTRLTTRITESITLTHPCVYWDDWFSEEELVKIETYLDKQHLYQATTMGDESGNDLSVRNSMTTMFRVDSENQWIFNKLLRLVDMINNEFYRYDLVGFDHLQYTVYDRPGCKYDFHMDTGLDRPLREDNGVLHRKLSFSLILNEDYTGGDFEILCDAKGPRPQEQKRGRVLAFPSWIIHRVTPIETGVRKSLVFWVKGPKFK